MLIYPLDTRQFDFKYTSKLTELSNWVNTRIIAQPLDWLDKKIVTLINLLQFAATRWWTVGKEPRFGLACVVLLVNSANLLWIFTVLFCVKGWLLGAPICSGSLVELLKISAGFNCGHWLNSQPWCFVSCCTHCLKYTKTHCDTSTFLHLCCTIVSC